MSLIEATQLWRSYWVGGEVVHALRAVDLRLEQGEWVAIIGPSGSGKSTLMHVIGLIDRPTAGTYLLDGVDTASLDDYRLAGLRNRSIGFVFQSFNLIAGESALENVATPLMYAGVKRAERLQRASAALESVGLGDRMSHDPSQLSGGQQQRVAIARALVTRPRLLLADEPTGNLDSASGAELLDVVRGLHAQGLTVLLITHDPRVASAADRVIEMTDGYVLSDRRRGESPAEPAPA
ncbi:MAG TPA: ABC transporter ATP-binding protein [Acidimicrobiales bacterium]|nr:ABC transporter ATP-binding protein [Acidimicrobiales bacterium]